MAVQKQQEKRGKEIAEAEAKQEAFLKELEKKKENHSP